VNQLFAEFGKNKKYLLKKGPRLLIYFLLNIVASYAVSETRL